MVWRPQEQSVLAAHSCVCALERAVIDLVVT